MTDPSADPFETLRLPLRPVAPRPEAARDLRARLHRRLGVSAPSDAMAMPKAVGLEYEVGGNPEGETVLFVHTGTATAYLPLMSEPALAERYRLVRYHRRGFAGSDPLDAAPSISDQARDAVALLAHLGIESAHVVGHSGSGVIALQLALDAPHLVRSIVLEEPAMHAIDPRWDDLALQAINPIAEIARDGDPRRAMERWMRGISLNWRVELTRTVPGGPQQTLDDAAAFFADVEAVIAWTPDHDRIAELSVPILYLVAANGAPLAKAVARRFRELVPHTDPVVIADAGHMLHTDQPHLVAAEMAAFFGRQAT